MHSDMITEEIDEIVSDLTTSDLEQYRRDDAKFAVVVLELCVRSMCLVVNCRQTGCV